MKQQLDWRRSKVLELSSQGYSEREISEVIKVSDTTVHRDLVHIREQARDNLQTHITETVADTYHKCLTGINQVLKMAWSIANKDIDNKTKLQALALINDCNKYKMNLATGGAICNEALKMVERKREELNKLDIVRLQQQHNERSEIGVGVGVETVAEEAATTNGVF